MEMNRKPFISFALAASAAPSSLINISSFQALPGSAMTVLIADWTLPPECPSSLQTPQVRVNMLQGSSMETGLKVMGSRASGHL